MYSRFLSILFLMNALSYRKLHQLAKESICILICLLSHIRLICQLCQSLINSLIWICIYHGLYSNFIQLLSLLPLSFLLWTGSAIHFLILRLYFDVLTHFFYFSFKKFLSLQAQSYDFCMFILLRTYFDLIRLMPFFYFLKLILCSI